MKCRACGNTYKFFEAYKAWDLVYYEEGSSTVSDSKSYDIQPVDDPRECAECGSTDIDEEEVTA